MLNNIRLPCDARPIRNHNVFSVLADVVTLERMGRNKIIEARDLIFRQGDDAIQYFGITSGIIKLVKTLANGTQRIVGFPDAPSFVGHCQGKYHTYSAEAVTDAELCCYPRGPFDAFLKTHPEVARKILEMTLRELDSSRAWSFLLRRQCSYERVAGFLLMIATRIPNISAGEIGTLPPKEKTPIPATLQLPKYHLENFACHLRMRFQISVE
jgi:CRP/FNR family transcriptional regulator, anaerobic regulatory protein